VAQIARNMTDSEDGFLRDMKYFICDHDVLYTKEFRETLESSGVEEIGAFGIASRSSCSCPISASLRFSPSDEGRGPQQNGYAERFVEPIQTECLEHFIFLGEKPLRRAVQNYVEHYHHERNHQGLDNLIPFPYAAHHQAVHGRDRSPFG